MYRYRCARHRVISKVVEQSGEAERPQRSNEGAEMHCGNRVVLFGPPVSSCHR